MSIRINEYYDLFDVKTINNTTTDELTNVPTSIKNTFETNPFRGFSNWENFNTNNPNNNEVILKVNKAPGVYSSIELEDNGNIICYPPPVSGVPYWDRIIFRNYDYNINVSDSSPYFNALSKIAYTELKQCQCPLIKPHDDSVSGDFQDNSWIPVPSFLWNKNNSGGAIDDTVIPDLQNDFTSFSGYINTNYLLDFNKCPIYLKFDEYQSRSKVIFSSCDKYKQNPDIEFKFGYHKNINEPIKLNLSLSANVSYTNNVLDANQRLARIDSYNYNLTKNEIRGILKSCYWCIEWIYDFNL